MTFSLRTTTLCLLTAVTLFFTTEAQAQRRRGGHDGLPAPVVNSRPDVPSRQAPHDAPTGDSRLISLAEPQPTTAPTGRGNINEYYAEGIDISHHQHHINWDLVASEPISYVYIKATEGETFVDDRYCFNIAEARRIGLSVGSYHFYRPNISWERQFANLISVVKADEQDLVPLIDIEVRGTVNYEKFISDIKQFVAAVERHYGKKPLIYSGQNFYNKFLAGHFPEHRFMIARYSNEQPLLSDGNNYIIWQYSEKGRVAGINTCVDRSRIIGDFSLREIGM